MQTGQFYSNGKFLISGEYAVIHGAKALAVPLRFGQEMSVTELDSGGLIHWQTKVQGNDWFSAIFNKKEFEVTETSDHSIAGFIRQLLLEASLFQPELAKGTSSFFIENEIGFDINWGLGSSSSLISNLSYWLDIDPYALYKKLFRGSGYDLFCARTDHSIVFQLINGEPVVQTDVFNPPFQHNIYFIYSGRKQDSQASVSDFLKDGRIDPGILHKISHLTDRMTRASDVIEFMELMNEHENIISDLIGLPPVQRELFPGFDGAIKSLGAWGGDFIMAVTARDDSYIKDYFFSKNLPVIFAWHEIVR
ncbi:MAG: GYDIA family GHMP kinase [Bacteroidales bacterium]|nr:GYDIA family GHMP kinase [Bacteroidales bacterium]